MGKDDQSRYLLLTTKGWKTGTNHQIKIWFVEYNGRYYITSETSTKAHWVQNIIHNPRVSIEISNNVFEATARIIDNEKEQELSNAVMDLMKDKYIIGSIVEIKMDIK
jgi:deazaflavin-dependent oxidoreductase (nitroreductase family)